MSRKLKVADDTQVVYRGKHYFSGETFTADNDDAEVDGWIVRGYVEPTAKGGRDVARKNKKKAIENHYVSQQRGLHPQGLEGRGAATPVTQYDLAREHFDRFFGSMSRP